MAEIYPDAELYPAKPEAVAAYLREHGPDPGVSAEALTLLASYRFDDPGGDVGMEVHLVRDQAGRLLQVPLTYRGDPHPAQDELLTIDHSVLGQRYVYGGLSDTMFLTQLVDTIVGGGVGARHVNVNDGSEITHRVANVRGTGMSDEDAPSVARAATPGVSEGAVHVPLMGGELIFDLQLDPSDDPSERTPNGMLFGTWPGQDSEVLLATIIPGSRPPVE